MSGDFHLSSALPSLSLSSSLTTSVAHPPPSHSSPHHPLPPPDVPSMPLNPYSSSNSRPSACTPSPTSSVTFFYWGSLDEFKCLKFCTTRSENPSYTCTSFSSTCHLINFPYQSYDSGSSLYIPLWHNTDFTIDAKSIPSFTWATKLRHLISVYQNLFGNFPSKENIACLIMMFFLFLFFFKSECSFLLGV